MFQFFYLVLYVALRYGASCTLQYVTVTARYGMVRLCYIVLREGGKQA